MLNHKTNKQISPQGDLVYTITKSSLEFMTAIKVYNISVVTGQVCIKLLPQSKSQFWLSMLTAIWKVSDELYLSKLIYSTIWASSWENLFLPYANNKGAD